jgi:tetratricopeptide (TPR) repeat protein
VPGVRVVARTSAQRLRDASKKLGEVAKQFHVRYVISGAVKKAGNRLHVTSEIVEASTGFQLWAGTDDLDPEQTETLCAQISRTVIHTLHVDAFPAQLTAIDRHLTKSPEAYQLYLLGRYHAARRNRAALEESVKVLQRAVDIDPEFAAGYAALGFSYYDLSARDRRDWGPLMGRSLDAAGRALKLDSNIAEAYLVIGCNQRTWGWDWNGAEESFKRALALNPSLVEGHRMYAHLLSRSARHTEALQQIDQALNLDPLNTGMKVSRATLLLYAGRTQEALEQYESVRSADPAYENVYIPMSDALELTGRMGDAIAACEHGVALTKRAAYALSSLGRLYGLAHRTAEANAILTELLERYKHDDASATEVAYLYLGLGDRDRAFEWLERGLPTRDSNLLLLKVGPEFEPLRSDSRYAGLLARLKL